MSKEITLMSVIKDQIPLFGSNWRKENARYFIKDYQAIDSIEKLGQTLETAAIAGLVTMFTINKICSGDISTNVLLLIPITHLYVNGVLGMNYQYLENITKNTKI